MTDLRVVYEDPDQPDAPLKILVPSPKWMEKAKAGDLPPVSVYWLIAEAEAKAQGPEFNHCAEVLELIKSAKKIGPLSEEEAIQYLIMKDIPSRVWAKKHNRQMFRIVHKDQLPTDREFRNAWRLAA